MVLMLGLALSYLFGSIPTAYIFGRLTKGIDIRKHGSGNVGATNAFRLLGWRIGITVFIIDALKGVIPAAFIADFMLRQRVPLDEITLRMAAGIIAVLGHSLSVFLRFKGGKGMATTLGVLLGLSLRVPMLGLVLGLELATWLAIFLLVRIVSLASIVSAISLPIFLFSFKQPLPLIIMGLGLALFIVIRHKSNIYRILHKQEPRFNLCKK